MKLFFRYALLSLTILSGCHQAPTNFEGGEAVDVARNVKRATDIPERKLIKDGYVEFETKSIERARQAIYQAVQKYSSYVASDEERNSAGRRTNTIVVRIPTGSFDTFLMEVTKGIDRFESRNVTVTDVTEEYLDVEARLKTKKELEARYLELLKRASKVTEILEIERQIATLREEIESVEGRVKYLENRITYSTLTITFFEPASEQAEFGKKLSEGLVNGWYNLLSFLVALTHVWPFLLISVAAIGGFRIYSRKKRGGIE